MSTFILDRPLSTLDVCPKDYARELTRRLQLGQTLTLVDSDMLANLHLATPPARAKDNFGYVSRAASPASDIARPYLRAVYVSDGIAYASNGNVLHWAPVPSMADGFYQPHTGLLTDCPTTTSGDRFPLSQIKQMIHSADQGEWYLQTFADLPAVETAGKIKGLQFKHQSSHHGIDSKLLDKSLNGIKDCAVVPYNGDGVSGNFFDTVRSKSGIVRQLENCSFIIMPVRL